MTHERESPRAYESGSFGWNLYRVPREIGLEEGTEPHPARQSAIFVVHGIGDQAWTQTAAMLRSGFEDALEEIENWQRKEKIRSPVSAVMPPPFVWEGYWGNYDQLEPTFPEDWARFSDRERKLFGNLWEIRIVSAGRTLGWFLRQQVRLLNPRMLFDDPLAWFIYLPVQVLAPVILLAALIRYPRVLTAYLMDVRLYVDPRGSIERAIVQNIDERVGRAFLRMIGLNWEFRPSPPEGPIVASGEAVKFERVVWVSHSLGTLISYNVLSDILHRAKDLEKKGDDLQKAGIARFRRSLTRFVTLGSPLDKIANLFPGSLREWPEGERGEWLEGGECEESRGSGPIKEWWINFYHVLDPVSGALSHPTLCGGRPPGNFHIKSGLLPGLAHTKYWTDSLVLRYVLGRTYGKKYLPDQKFQPWGARILTLIAFFGYILWGVVLYGALGALIYWGPGLAKLAMRGFWHWLTS